jgi:hypothetical protein
VAGRTGVRRRNAGDRRSLCIRAQSSGSPGDKESKQVLDAFFLGKAFAEAVNERVGTVIGEILSDIGRRQAEQQKQIREFEVAPLNSPLWTQIPNCCFMDEYSLNGDSPYGWAWFLLSLSFC